MARSFKIGIIGLGKMGQCILEGMLKKKQIQNTDFTFTVQSELSAQKMKDKFGVAASSSSVDLVSKCETIIIAVKPQNLEGLLGELASVDLKGKTIISIVASIPLSVYEKTLGKTVRLIRAMPNTPALVGEGMTAVCFGMHQAPHIEAAKMVFESIGKMVVLDEKHMDAVTGLSGCGPAYVYLILEALADAGIKVGLSREIATLLSAQTVLGASRMLLETQKHPAALKDEVTTPAGCTIDGLMELEEGKLRVTLIKAVVQATRRAKILGKKWLC